MGVAIRDGRLHYVVLTMQSGRGSRPATGVWVQEWFQPEESSSLHVSENRSPRGAAVDFSSVPPDVLRQEAFGLNTACFTKPVCCRTAE
jgi:hypothetical protein